MGCRTEMEKKRGGNPYEKSADGIVLDSETPIFWQWFDGFRKKPANFRNGRENDCLGSPAIQYPTPEGWTYLRKRLSRIRRLAQIIRGWDARMAARRGQH